MFETSFFMVWEVCYAPKVGGTEMGFANREITYLHLKIIFFDKLDEIMVDSRYRFCTYTKTLQIGQKVQPIYLPSCFYLPIISFVPVWKVGIAFWEFPFSSTPIPSSKCLEIFLDDFTNIYFIFQKGIAGQIQDLTEEKQF